MQKFYNIIAQPHCNAECRLYVQGDGKTLSPHENEVGTFKYGEVTEVIRSLEGEFSKGWCFGKREITFDNEFKLLWVEVHTNAVATDDAKLNNKIDKITTDIKKAIVAGKDQFKWRIGFSGDEGFVTDSLNEKCKFTPEGEKLIKHFKDLGLTVSDLKFGHDGMGVSSWNDVIFEGWVVKGLKD